MQTPKRLLEAVRTMGVEAMEEDHLKPELSGIQSLASRVGGETDVPYPSGAASGTCDLVLSDTGDQVWVEVKFASTYKSDSQPNQAGIPIRRQLTGPVTGSALKEIKDRLPSLVGRPGVDRIGFLLVVFHSEDLPLRKADIDQLELKSGLREGNWDGWVEDDWTNPRNERCRIRAYYWERRSR